MNLPFIPLPHAHEAPSSLIRRTALANGYNSCAVFLNHLFPKFQYFNLLFQGGQFESLMSAAATPYEFELTNSFYELTLQRDSQTRVIKLQTLYIPNRLLRYTEAAICTECWKDGWEQTIKDLKTSSCCPFHGRWYLSSCPTCKRRFSWHNQIQPQCLCGAILESPPAEEADAYPEKLLMRLLASGNQQSIDLFATTLMALNFYSRKKTSNETRHIFKVAIGLASNEFEFCNNSLDYLSGNNSDLSRAMLLAKLPTQISQLILEKVKLAPSLKPTIIRKASNDTLTTTQLCRLLDVNSYAWQKIRRHLQFPHQSRSRPSYNQKAIKKIIAIQLEIGKRPNTQPIYHNEEIIPYSQCRMILRMPIPEFSQLCIQGLLGEVFQTGRSTQNFLHKSKFDDFHNIYISIWELSSNLDLSVRRLRSEIINSKIESLSTDRGHASINPTPSFIQRIDVPVIESQLKQAKSSYLKNHKLLVNDFPLLPDELVDQVMTLKQASRHLNISVTFVRILMRSGILASCYKKHGHLYCVSKEAVDDCKSKYIFHLELAALLEIDKFMIPSVLGQHGIRHLASYAFHRQVYYIYTRKDFPPELIEKLNPIQCDYGRSRTRNELLDSHVVRQELNVSSVDFHKLVDDIFKIRPLHYRTVFHQRYLTCSEVRDIHSIILHLAPINKLAIKYGISTTEIVNRFIRPKALFSININGRIHILKQDQSDLAEFYKSNITIKEANKLTGLPNGYLQSLISRGVLVATKPPLRGNTTPTTLSKISITYAVARYTKNGSKLLLIKPIPIR